MQHVLVCMVCTVLHSHIFIQNGTYYTYLQVFACIHLYQYVLMFTNLYGYVLVYCIYCKNLYVFKLVCI